MLLSSDLVSMSSILFMVLDVSIENLTRRGLEDETVVRPVPVVLLLLLCV